MGLHVSHGCFDAAYTAFHRWRIQLAHTAGMPPLELMEGFFFVEKAVTGNPFWRSLEEDKRSGYVYPDSIWYRLPIKWDALKQSPLHLLLAHSDCSGEIPWEKCMGIAHALEELIPFLPKGDTGSKIGDYRDATFQFVKGLRSAYEARENVTFG